MLRVLRVDYLCLVLVLWHAAGEDCRLPLDRRLLCEGYRWPDANQPGRPHRTSGTDAS